MPASYAHALFGQRVFKKLDENLQQLIKPYEKYYAMGLYGPDPFFFYQPYHHHPLNRLGYQIHEADAYFFFTHAREVLKTASNPQAALVYMCGFMNHFILDSECHGYIGIVEREKHLTHAQIESDFDRQLLVNEGYTPHQTPLNQWIYTDKKIAEVMGPFYNKSTNEMHKVIKSMHFYTRVLYCPHTLKRILLQKGMDLIHASSMKGMIILKDAHPQAKESTEHLMELMDQSEDIAVVMIRDFVNLINTDLPLSDRLHRNFE